MSDEFNLRDQIATLQNEIECLQSKNQHLETELKKKNDQVDWVANIADTYNHIMDHKGPLKENPWEQIRKRLDQLGLPPEPPASIIHRIVNVACMIAIDLSEAHHAVGKLHKEIKRLSEGDLTEEEVQNLWQNLWHNLHQGRGNLPPRCVFERECKIFQERIYGPKVEHTLPLTYELLCLSL